MEIVDPHFRKAVQAIDNGDLPGLEATLKANPSLVRDRLRSGDEGYFKDPYLLWFVAENPVRNEKLPRNIVDVTRLIIEFAKAQQVATLADQVNYTLGLVCSGRVSREQKLQGPLIDLLVHSGGDPQSAIMPALFHKELEAITKLTEHNATITLPVAIALNRTHTVQRLLPAASKSELQIALTAAAFYGHADFIKSILSHGVEVSAWNPKGFHEHSTPLHQAVWSGSLESVKILIQAGADIRIKDKIHKGNALTWAIYCNQPHIADYLRTRIATAIVDKLIENAIVPPDQKQQAVQVIASGFKDLNE